MASGRLRDKYSGAAFAALLQKASAMLWCPFYTLLQKVM
jgi:hypothetical protein